MSWIGYGYSHGVIYDFYKKLKNSPQKLHILGNGQQKKSYLDVRDGVKVLFTYPKRNINIFTLGHYEVMNVNNLADIVCKEMNLANVEYIYAGEKEVGLEILLLFN